MGGIVCALEKAFDCINHIILLSKLKFHGITGKGNALFKSYLKDRYQRVIIYNTDLNHNILCRWGKIKHSVPQGSILGPLLFHLYTNDLPKIINNKSKPTSFSDDTSIIITNPYSTDCKNGISTVFDHVINGLKSIYSY